ncbi:MAG: YcxB family protein [Actinomycetota bacterium]
MNQEVLELEYKVDYKQFRKVWIGQLKKSLPNIISFWGVTILLALLIFFLFSDKFIGFLLLFVFSSIPLFMIIFGYQNFMKTAKQNFSTLSDKEKIVHLTFQNGADGFDSRNGKSFSHTAWESIKSVTELNDCFVFNRMGSVFYVPKSAFRNDSEIGFLRFLVSVNVNKNVKLMK